MTGTYRRPAVVRPRTGQAPRLTVSPPLSLAPSLVHEDRRAAASDGYAALWIAVLQQALVDASSDGPETIAVPDQRPGRRCMRSKRVTGRAADRWDAVLFFAGAVRPGYCAEPDPHPVPLTFATICDLLGWDVGRVGRHVLGLLRERSPLHARLVAEAEAAAKDPAWLLVRATGRRPNTKKMMSNVWPD